MKNILMVAALGAAAAMSAYALPACVTLNDASFAQGTYDADPGTGTGTWVGTSCTIGSDTFSNFAVYGNTGTFAGGISVAFTVVGNTLDIGTTNLGSNDIEIYYTITSGVGSISLSGGPGENVTEEVCGVAYNQAAGNEICASPLNQSNLQIIGGSPAQSTSSVNAAAVDYIVKDDSGGSSVTQGFSTVPEPMTLSLMGAGLLGLGLLKRKIRK